MEKNLENNNIIYIKVNNKDLTEEEFITLKENVSKSKDIQLVEVAPNSYKTRLFG